MYDVVIIGAGIIGSSISRELSKYHLKTIILEKSYDVSNGTTKANSAIVHAGYDPIPGTYMAKFNSMGNAMFPKLCKDLSVPFKQIGSLVIAFNNEEIDIINELFTRGKLNNIPDIKILNSDEILKLEPNINPEVKKALWCGTAGVVSPYELAIALCENAHTNGIEIKLDCEVLDITKAQNYFELKTAQGVIKSKLIINAAGIFADQINSMISSKQFKIKPVKGQYLLLNKTTGNLAKHVIFQCPTKLGKGILVTPTVYGNTLIGPDAQSTHDKNDTSICEENFENIIKTALKSFTEIPFKKAIKTFAGLRAESDSNDFIIAESEDVTNFINVAGIKSPGLSASPAIALYVSSIVLSKFTGTDKKASFEHRRTSPMLKYNNEEKQKKLLADNICYSNIICKCEQISEGEIRDAVNRYPYATTRDGVKRRVRAGMGPCQGSRCGPKVDAILSQMKHKQYQEKSEDENN